MASEKKHTFISEILRGLGKFIWRAGNIHKMLAKGENDCV